MITEFVIREWAAWAPTLAERDQWLDWASGEAPVCPPLTEEAPALGAMAAMSRRRLNPLGRMAADVVYSLAGPQGTPSTDGEASAEPVIYASRYGDARRSLALLDELARGEPISPTAFGLSVHNAIGALISIARQDRAHHSALAAGAASAGVALVEAAGLLADGESSVLVVHYDTGLPSDYASFADEPGAPYAWAWRVALPQGDEPRIRLQLSAAADGDGAPTVLPFGLGLLRFGLSNRPQWAATVDGQRWNWSRP